MRYAGRAKNIQNRTHVNEEPKDALLRHFQEEIAELKRQLEEGSFNFTPDDIEECEEEPEEIEIEDIEENGETNEMNPKRKKNKRNEIDKEKTDEEKELLEKRALENQQELNRTKYELGIFYIILVLIVV